MMRNSEGIYVKKTYYENKEFTQLSNIYFCKKMHKYINK